MSCCLLDAASSMWRKSSLSYSVVLIEAGGIIMRQLVVACAAFLRIELIQSLALVWQYSDGAIFEMTLIIAFGNASRSCWRALLVSFWMWVVLAIAISVSCVSFRLPVLK